MLAEGQDIEPDRGPRSGGSAVERMCAATRAVRPAEEMVRFVEGPDGIVPDLKRKLPGRGVWVTATRQAVSDAVQRKAFARSFKREVRVPPDLAAQTERLLQRAVLDALAIAGKSGLAVAGFGKVEAALGRDRVVAILHAANAARDGVGKIAGALRARPDAARIATIAEFAPAQLDLALGRSNVVHAALLAGPASDTFLARFQRLEHFRSGQPGEGRPGSRPDEGRIGH